jgi:hypothetical protein
MVQDPRFEFLACTKAARELRSRSAAARRVLKRTRATSREAVAHSKLAKAKVRATSSQLSWADPGAAAMADWHPVGPDVAVRKDLARTDNRSYWADVRQQAKEMAEHAREMRSNNSALQERVQELQFQMNAHRFASG